MRRTPGWLPYGQDRGVSTNAATGVTHSAMKTMTGVMCGDFYTFITKINQSHFKHDRLLNKFSIAPRSPTISYWPSIMLS